MQLLACCGFGLAWLGCRAASMFLLVSPYTIVHTRQASPASAILHIFLRVCQVDEIASLVPRACIMLVAGQSVVENVAYATELFSQHHQLSAGQLDSRLPQPLLRA